MNRLVFFHSLTILVLALGLVGLTACQSRTATTSDKLTRTLTVSGKGDIKIPTTLTEVRLGVQFQGKTPQEVQKQVAEKSAAVVDFLKSQKVEKLETTGINLNPNYSYSNGKQRIDGYIGQSTVMFRVTTEKAGTLLDDAVQAGATRIDGISFVAAETEIKKAQQAALKEAIEDAQGQSQAVLQAMNFNQREVVNIQINNAEPPQPLFAAETASLTANQKVALPVVGGEQTVTASVTLQIKY